MTTDLNIIEQEAINALTPLASNAAALSMTAEGYVIETQEQAETLVDLRRQIQIAIRKVDDERKNAKQRPFELCKRIDEFYKPPLDQLRKAAQRTKELLDEYARTQAMIERGKREAELAAAKEAEAKAQEQVEVLRASGATEAADAVEKVAQQKVVAASTKPKVAGVRGKQAQLITRREWKGKVFNIKEVAKAVAQGRLPADVIEIRQAAVDSLAKDVAKECDVHGITVYEHISTVTK